MATQTMVGGMGSTRELEYPHQTAAQPPTTSAATSIWDILRGYVLGTGREVPPSVTPTKVSMLSTSSNFKGTGHRLGGREDISVPQSAEVAVHVEEKIDDSSVTPLDDSLPWSESDTMEDWWVPASYFTMKRRANWRTEDRFDTLYEYGGDWSDRSKVRKKDLDEWEKAMRCRVSKRFLTKKEVDSMWPNTLSTYPNLSSVMSKGEDGLTAAWKDDHNDMVSQGFKVLFRTKKDSTHYLGTSEDIEEMEGLKKRMNKTRKADGQKMKDLSTMAKSGKHPTAMRVVKNNLVFSSYVGSALDHLEQYLDKVKRATSKEESTAAEDSYRQKLREQDYLFSFQVPMLYPDLVLGIHEADVMNTLRAAFENSKANFDSSEDKECTWDPKKLSTKHQTVIKQWLRQNARMLKRRQTLLLPYTEDGKVSNLVPQEIIDRGNTLLERLDELKANTSSAESSHPSCTSSVGTSRHFNRDSFWGASRATTGTTSA